MQRTNFLAASAVGVVASLAGAGLAVAQPRSQAPSNENLRDAYGVVAELIDELSADQKDYAGHRVAAIAQLNNAKGQLYEALKTRQQVQRGQGASDTSLRYARQALARIIGNLRDDRHDYSGHRVAAIGDLVSAAADIDMALQSR